MWLSETWVKTDWAMAKSKGTPKSTSNRSLARRFDDGQAVALLVTELDVVARLDEAVVGVDGEVVTRVEVVDEVPTGTERAAADVEEAVVWLEALALEVLQLALAVGVPHTTDEGAVRACLDLLRGSNSRPE